MFPINFPIKEKEWLKFYEKKKQFSSWIPHLSLIVAFQQSVSIKYINKLDIPGDLSIVIL